MRLSVFVSSPGDVAEERELAARVITRLQSAYAGRIELTPIFWEAEPLRATASFNEELARPSTADIFVCILWSRLGTRLPKHLRKPSGEAYESGTEFEFLDAFAAFRTNGAPDILVYRKLVEPVVSLRDRRAAAERLRQIEALDRFLSTWFQDPEDGSLIAAFHPFVESAEFEDLLETHLRKLVDRRAPDADDAAPRATSFWHDQPPFRGLDVFDFEHAPIFFGRTRAVADVLSILRGQAAVNRAFVVVLGASGAGKSSLVRAGVLPLLTRSGVIEDVTLWRRTIFRPTDSLGDLFDALAAALVRPEALPELLSDGTTTAQVAEALRSAPGTAATLVKGALSQAAVAAVRPTDQATRPHVARLIVAVDQFEEVFTRPRASQAEWLAFAQALDSLARGGRCWVIATLRSDFYARLQQIDVLVALKEGLGQYDLKPPTPAELAQMIRQPVALAGLRFERDHTTDETLDDLIRDEAMREQTVPLLEFTLRELYEQRDGHSLTIESYRRLGGVEGALARRAEQTFSALTPAHQAALDPVLRALVGVSVGEIDTVTRYRASLEPLRGTPAQCPLIDAFVEARLFVTDRSDDGTPLLFVAHEALLQKWPRCRAWIDDNRKFLRTRTRLTAAAAEWHAHDRNIGFLIAEGLPLSEGKGLLTNHRDSLRPELVEYIERSAEHHQRSTNTARSRGLTVAVVVLMVFAGGGYYLQKNFAIVQLRAEARSLSDRGIVAEGKKQWPEASSEYAKALARTKRLASLLPADPAVKQDVAIVAARTSHAMFSAGEQESMARDIAVEGLDADEHSVRDGSSNTEALGTLTLIYSDLIDDLREHGHATEARRMALRSLTIDEQLLNADPTNELLQQNVATSYGQVATSTTDALEAVSARSRALSVSRSLADENPGDSSRRHDVATGYKALGDALGVAGRWDKALPAYIRAIRDHKAVARYAGPRNPKWQTEVAIAFYDAGWASRKLGHYPRALAYHFKSAHLLERLLENDPSLAPRRTWLAILHAELAVVLSGLGRSDEALRRRQLALALREDLARSGEPANESALAEAHALLGSEMIKLGDLGAVSREYESARALRESLATKYPHDQAHLHAVMVSRALRGDLLWQQGSVRDAGDLYEVVLAEQEERLRSNPRDITRYSEVSETACARGWTSTWLGQIGQARQAYERCGTVRRAAMARESTSVDRRMQYATALSSLGTVALAEGHLDEAERLIRKAFVIRERVSRRYPEQVPWAVGFGNSLEQMALLAKTRGDLTTASRWYRENLSLRRRLATVDTHNKGRYADLAVAAWKLGDVLVLQDAQSEGLHLLQESVDLREELALLDRSNTYWASRAAMARETLASALDQIGDFSGAVAHARRAVDELTALEHHDPANQDRHAAVSAALETFGRALLHADRLDDAVEALSRAKASREALLRVDPSNVLWRAGLASTEEVFAEAWLRRRRSADALAASERAIDAWTSAGALDRRNAIFLAGYATALGTRARAAKDLDRLDEAERSRQQAEGLWRHLTSRDPTNAAWHRLAVDVTGAEPHVVGVSGAR
jgi:tetratricopeptide (TPR) repeat protein